MLRAELPAFDLAVDLLAIGVTDDPSSWAALDARLNGALAAVLAQRSFTGKPGSSASFHPLGAIAAREVMLIGVGDRSASAIGKAAGKVGRHARDASARTVAVDFGALTADAVDQLVDFVHIGNYAYEPYKPESERTPAIASLQLVGVDTADGGASAEIRNRWVSFVRDLVNAPAAEIYPATFAARAAQLEELDDVEVEILGADALRDAGYVGILAVGQGSVNEPRLVHIRYRPDNAVGHVVLVGKGVTFDSGGLSLKPSGSMQTMRCDMAGAATAVGTLAAAAEQRLPIAIDAIVGLVENMNSGSSYKLGDILKYSNGVTVEIHNTDAEGRLVLADCLIRACEIDGATDVIDLATLTGAVVVALGCDFTGVFTADDGLAGEIAASAAAEGEGAWRLPLHDGYKSMLKGDWGQIKNITGKPDAGSCTAALFLQYFVKDKRWAHLDIAGAAFADRASGPYAAGGTGQMTRTLLRWMAGRIG